MRSSTVYLSTSDPLPTLTFLRRKDPRSSGPPWGSSPQGFQSFTLGYPSFVLNLQPAPEGGRFPRVFPLSFLRPSISPRRSRDSGTSRQVHNPSGVMGVRLRLGSGDGEIPVYFPNVKRLSPGSTLRWTGDHPSFESEDGVRGQVSVGLKS